MLDLKFRFSFVLVIGIRLWFYKLEKVNFFLIVSFAHFSTIQ